MLKIQILLIIITSCFFIKNETRSVQLENQINSILLEKNGVVTIKLDSIITFQWDRAIIMTPYRPLDSYEKEFAISLDKVRKAIENYDNIIVIGFLNQSQCIAYIELNRNFRILDESISIYTKDESFIEIEMY